MYYALHRLGSSAETKNRYALAVSCASFLNTYAGPIALGKITWKVSSHYGPGLSMR
jgi:hypothetical protein